MEPLVTAAREASEKALQLRGPGEASTSARLSSVASFSASAAAALSSGFELPVLQAALCAASQAYDEADRSAKSRALSAKVFNDAAAGGLGDTHTLLFLDNWVLTSLINSLDNGRCARGITRGIFG